MKAAVIMTTKGFDAKTGRQIFQSSRLKVRTVYERKNGDMFINFNGTKQRIARREKDGALEHVSTWRQH